MPTVPSPTAPPAPAPAAGQQPVADPPSARASHRRGALAGDRRLITAVVVVTAVSLAGSVLAVRTGLSPTWWDAVGPTGRLSVPLPMNAALLLLAAVAGSRRRRVALPAAVLLALATGVAVVSGAFDGGYAAELTLPERVAQVALVVGLTTVSVLAGRRAVAVARS